MRASHVKDFNGFGVSYDNYYTTHSEENRFYSELIYQRLKDRGLIFEQEVEQLYDPEKSLFLADRFVRGTCPNCKTEDQPGDNCSKCGTTYSPADLINPKAY